MISECDAFYNYFDLSFVPLNIYSFYFLFWIINTRFCICYCVVGCNSFNHCCYFWLIISLHCLFVTVFGSLSYFVTRSLAHVLTLSGKKFCFVAKSARNSFRKLVATKKFLNCLKQDELLMCAVDFCFS